MKKFILFILLCIMTISCTNREWYKHTDDFVNSLYSSYESYGLSGSNVYTEDGNYKIMPIGRLINVRIEKNVNDNQYKKLLKQIKRHYKNNWKVKNVYICNAGTIMIDCRH